MNRLKVILVAVFISVAAAAVGYFYGHDQGAKLEAAKHDKATVAAMTGLIESHKTLIADAAKASASMRGALSRRAKADEQTTTELKDALSTTASQRAGCVFTDDVMRQLGAARNRAAEAAASGIQGTLPAAAASTARPGG